MRLCVLGLFVLIFSSANAQHFVPISLAERVSNSTLIVEGKVINRESVWDDQHDNIFTINTVEVTATIKGNLPFAPRAGANTVKVVTRGGQVGTDLELVSPDMSLRRNETGIFTLVPNRTSISGKGQLFERYAGVQGFIKYDEILDRASDIFNTYPSISADLLNPIASMSGQRIQRFVPEVNEPIPMMAISASATIANFSPDTVTAGTKTVFTINGTGFGATQGSSYVEFLDANYGGAAVYIAPLATEYISWSDTKIEVEVPYRAGTGIFRVTDGTNTVTSSTGVRIEYNAYTYDFGGSAEPLRLKDNDGLGGYSFQQFTGFAANTAASNDFQEMLDEWICATGIPWTIGANTTTDATADDGLSIIRFDNALELPSGALGITTSRLSVCAGEIYIREIDMNYSTTVTWNFGTGSPGGSEYDFRSTLIHELGHAHGLGHVINAGSVMYYALANGSQDRTLSSDDIAGGDWLVTTYSVAPACGIFGPIAGSGAAPVPDAAALDTVQGSCGVTVSTTPTATDGCDGTINGTTTDPLTYSNSGLHTITWSYTDGSGNTVTQEQIVFVSDTVSPIPDLASLGDLNGSCSVTATAPTATDDCGGTITATTPGGLTFSEDTTIVWTYTDGVGNTTTQTQNVIISDVNAPVPDVASLPDLNSDCNYTVTTFPSATDDCSGAVTASTSDTLYYNSPGTYTINWTYTDAGGNSVGQSQNVVIADATAPIPNLATLPDATGDCSLTVTPPTATDACDGTITAFTSDSVSFTTPGTRTILWYYQDAAGNIDSQYQAAVVGDVTAPLADLSSLPPVFGECSATATVPTATDGCDGVVAGTTTDPLTYTAQGTYPINWTYTDAAGNSSSQIQYVVVADATAPAPDATSLPDVTGSCSATVTSTPTATDNCFGAVAGFTTDSLTYDVPGTHVVTWQFTDAVGNTSTQLQNVIISDGTAPVADSTSLPDLIASCSVTAIPPTATDNCDGSILATTTDGLTHTASTTITWTFTDGAGNTSVQAQNVVITDVDAPVPNDTALTTLAGECDVTISTYPTATDNCDGALTATTTDTLYYDSPGSYVVKWAYTDGSGNSVIQNQTVVIADVSAPVPNLGSLPDVTGDCSATATAPTATDNCDGAIIGSTTDPLTYTTPGTHSITWTYTDAAGNSNTQLQNVIIADLTAPVADNPSLPTINGECSASVSSSPTATDVCDGPIVATTTDPLSYSSPGTYMLTWTYTDASGNSSAQTQFVVIADATDPVPDSTSLADVVGDCSVTVTTVPTSTDNCDGPIVATTTDPLSYTTAGSYSIEWVFTDAAGNSETQFQDVIVNDALAPVPDTATLPAINGTCSVTLTPPTAMDDCDGMVTATTTDGLTHVSSTTVVWTYTDAAGNMVAQNQSVIVTDELAPEISCPMDTVFISADPVPFSYAIPNGMDNCDGSLAASLTTGLGSGANFPIGLTTETYTVTDAAGNSASCSFNVEIEEPQSTGLGNPSDQTESALLLYPNPTTGMIFVDGFSGSGLMKIYSADGSLVHERQYNSGEPVFVGGAAGLYTIVLTVDEHAYVERFYLMK